MSWWDSITDFFADWDIDDYVKAGINAYGLYQGRDAASMPDMPQQFSPEMIKQLMFQNLRSPYGNRTFVEGDDGSMTEHFQFTPQQQQIYDRLHNRSLNPSQAYNKPAQLDQLQQALMNQRLEQLGLTPQSGYLPPRNAPPIIEPVEADDSDFNQAPAGGGTNTATDVPYTSREGSQYSKGQYVYGGSEMSGPSGSSSPYGSGFHGPLDLTSAINNTYADNVFNVQDPNEVEQFMIEHGDDIGKLLSAMSGIPGLGWLAGMMQDKYWENNVWANQSDVLQGQQDAQQNDMYIRATDGNYIPGEQSVGYSPFAAGMGLDSYGIGQLDRGRPFVSWRFADRKLGPRKPLIGS